MVALGLTERDIGDAVELSGVKSSTSSVLERPLDELYQSGLYRQWHGDPDGAEEDFRTVLVSDPNHAGACHFLGVLLHAKGRDKESLAYFRKSIELSCDNATYHNNYGVALKEAGRVDDAGVMFQKAVELDPGHADAHSNIGCIALIRNELREAECHLGIALSLKPDHPDALVHFRKLRFRQGHHFHSQEDFHRANNAFQDAAAQVGGRELWRWKSLGFCPSVFPDIKSTERYWRRLDHALDLAFEAKIPIDWRSLPTDGFMPSFNLPHLDRCCRCVKEKFARLFEKTFPRNRLLETNRRRDATKIRVGLA